MALTKVTTTKVPFIWCKLGKHLLVNNSSLCLVYSPGKITGNSEGVGESQKHFCKGNYDAKLKFPEGWGV